MTTAQIELPPKLIPVFVGDARFRCAYGGRGSGKSFSFAKMTAVRGYMHGQSGRSGQILCAREIMNSLEESSMIEVKKAILSEPWLSEYYDVGEKYIRSKDGRIRYTFSGLLRNLDSVKSKSDVLICWVDEAENISEAAWRKLRPTVRESGSEVWVTWNPESPDSATHNRYRATTPDRMKIVELNWRDNPWWSRELEEERLDEQRNRPETYDHVYEGKFLTQTEAQVFHNKHEMAEFEPAPSWQGPYFGVDFGFRPDPLSAVEVYVHGEHIYIRREAYANNVEIDATAKFITDKMPAIFNYVSRADSAEPKTISYLQRHGLPRMEGVKKWPNSIIEGIRFIRGYKSVIIHPDCPNTARDFRLYSHKIDKKTEDILPDVEDANNHAPDAVRYALAPLIKAQGAKRVEVRL